jgi:hypothetical protein
VPHAHKVVLGTQSTGEQVHEPPCRGDVVTELARSLPNTAPPVTLPTSGSEEES